MTEGHLRQTLGLLHHYRMPLLCAAVAMALGLIFGRHLNSSDEAGRALSRVYAGAGHLELCFKEPVRPTR